MKILYVQANGALAIISPTKEMFDPKSRTRAELSARRLTFETEAEVMAYIVSKDVPVRVRNAPAGCPTLIPRADAKRLGIEFSEIPYEVVEDSAIPTDRSFRDAWRHSGGVISVDMDKAREIHKGRLRQLRKPKFERLDVAYARADEAGDAVAKANIAAQKQALRDVTLHPDIAAATSPEELKGVLPDFLR